MKNIDTFDF